LPRARTAPHICSSASHWRGALSGNVAFVPQPSGSATYLARRQKVNSPFIAIVDDDEMLCASLADLMRAVDYRAEAFTSAEAILASPSLPHFQCVIADVHMPSMSGIQLLQKLRGQGTTTPVILTTALPDERLDDEAASAGAICLLRKPFKTETLLEHIEECLSGHGPLL
jgi:FixJ family two-component response regulator